MKATSPALVRDTVTESLDWHDVANDRLAKITDLEHVVAVTRERLNTLQGERHQLVQQHHAEVTQLKQQLSSVQEQYGLCRTHEMQLEARLDAAMRRETDLLSSTSWQVTRPLRALSIMAGRVLRLVRRGH